MGSVGDSEVKMLAVLLKLGNEVTGGGGGVVVVVGAEALNVSSSVICDLSKRK